MSARLGFRLDDVLPIAEHALACPTHRLTGAGARPAPIRRRSRFPSKGRRAQKKKRPMLSHETLLPPTDLWSGTNPPGQASHLVS